LDFMKIPRCLLVTGGCGFAGSAVVNHLLAETDIPRIAVLDNLLNGRRLLAPESSRLVLHEVDLRDGDAACRILEQERPETVIHLAALHFIPYCNSHPGETLEVNVVGTQNLLEACRACSPTRIIIASTMAVYPVKDGFNCEDDPAGPTDIYGMSKWINEQQLELFARQTGIRCAAARLSNIYGPNETNPHVIPEIFDQAARGQTELALGNVEPKRDYVYTSDVARALILIAQKSDAPYRVYNVGTGIEYSVEEVVNRLARISGRRLRIRVAADRVRKAERMHLLADPRRLMNETGWRPAYDLDRGLSELWRWYVKRTASEATVLAAR
jgi:UDP-glucose 4-epimerase